MWEGGARLGKRAGWEAAGLGAPSEARGGLCRTLRRPGDNCSTRRPPTYKFRKFFARHATSLACTSVGLVGVAPLVLGEGQVQGEVHQGGPPPVHAGGL